MKPNFKKTVMDLVEWHQPIIFVIIETHIDDQRADDIIRRLPFDGHILLKPLGERGRRLPASSNWTACKVGGVIFNKGLKWSISNGEVVSAWDDFWLASGPLRKLIQGPLLEGEGKKSAKEFLANVLHTASNKSFDEDGFSIGSSAVKALERTDLLLPQIVQDGLNDQLHKFMSSLENRKFNQLFLKENLQTNAISCSSHLHMDSSESQDSQLA
ncbi:hypothetical protein CFP56_032768 [Quercus suber]|uniref:Uncharacterized protein n=1 Tax=Quercus suber TaxID=58331 RepID=A0AAW0JGH6_QUESU